MPLKDVDDNHLLTVKAIKDQIIAVNLSAYALLFIAGHHGKSLWRGGKRQAFPFHFVDKG
ncbi:hypothetical protein O206_14625 [Ochrobactrum sp. EGD-AQ16]|nr:hypothetical protein O206_14625 [Ochrobactrum sp. EGD-AQ16]